jgi:tRNA/tmRNA/rRNA uracil-C5-methylase (TrmA/RlmC/RlmD family)
MMTLDEDDQRACLGEMLQSEFGLKIDSFAEIGSALGYRYSAKRIAFGGPGKMRLGSYVRGTHRPADMNGCLVEHPAIARCAEELVEHARGLGVVSHDERDGSRGLRAVWFKTNGKDVLVTLVVSTEPDTAEHAALHNALLQLAGQLTCAGVSMSVQNDGGNALRGDSAELLRGEESIEFGGVRVGALGFLQPNAPLAERMYRDLIDGVSGRVFDLYAGSGATTRLLADAGADVSAAESHPESAAALGVPACSAEDFLAQQEGPVDVVVANPPRKGMGQAVCDQILRLAPAELRVMACGPGGLAKDLERLGECYELVSLVAYDTLPQTPHVELIAKLRRR